MNLHKVRDQGQDAQGEEDEDDPHDGADVFGFAGADFDDDPGHDAEHDAVGDGVGQGHHGDGHETADGVRDVAVELHLGDRGHHQHTNIKKGRGGREGRDGQEDRAEEQRDEEHGTGGGRG